MSNLIFNIRLGTRFFQVRRDSPYFSFSESEYWKKNYQSGRDKWFAVYCWFGTHYY